MRFPGDHRPDRYSAHRQEPWTCETDSCGRAEGIIHRWSDFQLARKARAARDLSPDLAGIRSEAARRGDRGCLRAFRRPAVCVPRRGSRLMARAAKPALAAWRNRIVGEAEVPAAELKANPRNWRTHPENQRAALDGVLS